MRILLLALLGACLAVRTDEIEQGARCETCGGDDGGDWIVVDGSDPRVAPALAMADDILVEPLIYQECATMGVPYNYTSSCCVYNDQTRREVCCGYRVVLDNLQSVSCGTALTSCPVYALRQSCRD